MKTELYIDIGQPNLVFLTQVRIKHQIRIVTHTGDKTIETSLDGTKLFGAFSVHIDKLKKENVETSLPHFLSKAKFETVVHGWALQVLNEFLGDVQMAEVLSEGNGAKSKAERRMFEDRSKLIKDYVREILAYPTNQKD